MPITVLLADDTEVIRRAISSLLTPHPAVQIVGEASDFAQTIQMANDLKPQVIVMDLHMSKHDCDPDRDLRPRLNRGSKLLAISLSNDEEAEELAASLGAVRLVDKMNLYDELIPAIHTVGFADCEYTRLRRRLEAFAVRPISNFLPIRPNLLSGRMGFAFRLRSVVPEVSSLVGKRRVTTGAFALFPIGREFGLRREIIVGQRFGYRRMGEGVTAVLAGQNPACHRPLVAPAQRPRQLTVCTGICQIAHRHFPVISNSSDSQIQSLTTRKNPRFRPARLTQHPTPPPSIQRAWEVCDDGGCARRISRATRQS